MFLRRKIPSASPLLRESETPQRLAPRSPSEALKPTAPPPPPPRVRRPRGGMLSAISGLLSLGLVVALAAILGVVYVERRVSEPGPLAADKVVAIPRSTGTSEMADLLKREGVINQPFLFELYAYLNRQKGQLKAGEVLFKAHTSLEEAIDTLIQGKAILHALTIPEGLTSEQIVGRLRENGVLTGEANETPGEGTLLPDTWKFDPGMTRQNPIARIQPARGEVMKQVRARRATFLP